MSDKTEAVDEGVSETFAVSEKSSANVGDVMSQDADDEALAKWKASLLGDAASGDVYAPADDPRRVVVARLEVMFNGHDSHVYELADQAAVDGLKDNPVTLKEGCEYKLKIAVRVQHEIVTGLKFQNTLSRKGVKMGTTTEMVGSFGPQETPHEITMPRREWEEAPSGMLARGDYKATAKFIDDDGKCHLQFDWYLKIKKDW